MRVGWLILLLAACSEAEPPSAPADAGASVSDAAVIFSDAGVPADASLPGDGGLQRPDSGAAVDQCDPLLQNCPDPDKCVVEGGAATQCVAPRSDEQSLGDACMGRDCERGLACVRLVQTSTSGQCVKICDLNTGDGCDGLGDDYECRTRITGSNWGACSLLPPLCDPYTQDPCAADRACQPFVRRNGTWEFRCRLAGTATEGEACGASAPCARELACVSDRSGNAACRRICQANTDCTGTSQCVGVVDEPPFMYCAP